MPWKCMIAFPVDVQEKMLLLFAVHGSDGDRENTVSSRLFAPHIAVVSV